MMLKLVRRRARVPGLLVMGPPRWRMVGRSSIVAATGMRSSGDMDADTQLENRLMKTDAERNGQWLMATVRDICQRATVGEVVSGKRDAAGMEYASGRFLPLALSGGGGVQGPPGGGRAEEHGDVMLHASIQWRRRCDAVSLHKPDKAPRATWLPRLRDRTMIDFSYVKENFEWFRCGLGRDSKE